MEEQIKNGLEKFLGINRARIGFIRKFLIALIKTRSSNLKRISLAFESKASGDSVYRNIQKYFLNFELCQKEVAKLILSFLPKDEKFFLSMDRTNWKFGKANINILTVGVVFCGVAFPIAWKLLDKRGNSDTEERKEVVKNALEILGKQRCKGLLADREFVGEKWFSWLIAENIPFWIRIKENFLVENTDAKTGEVKRISVSKCFRWLRKYPRHLSHAVVWNGVKIFLSAGKGKDGEFCIIASNQADPSALGHYKKRWAIETFFGFLKSKGFDFEATHMTNQKKIAQLFSLLSIAFSWAFIIGIKLEKLKPPKIKKHLRKAISTFRVGLDSLQKLFLNNFSPFSPDSPLQFLPCT